VANSNGAALLSRSWSWPWLLTPIIHTCSASDTRTAGRQRLPN